LRLVGAYRDTEVRPEDPISVALADLAHAGLASRRLLGPLTPDEAAHLFEGLLGIDAAEEGGMALREHVLQRAGGVPFFLVSCAQALQREDREDPGEGSVPWSIAQSVRQRVAALPEVAREVLGVAAVVGRVVEGGLLPAVAARPEDEVLLGVEAACRARLLEERGGAAYRFAHDVIREVIEADLGAARRTLLHRRVAEALERPPWERQIELLAYHYCRSDVQGKAILYLEQAGDKAQAQYAHATAETSYRELLARLDGLERAAHEAHVREKLGTTLEMAAQYGAALDALEQAATTYQRIGNLEGLRRALAQVGRVHASRGTPEAGLARLQGQLEQLTSGGPSAGAGALHAALAWLFVACGRFRESIAAAERAAESARAVGAERILADVEVRRSMALVCIGRLDEGRRVAEAAIPLVEAVGDLSALGRIFNILGIIAKLQGEFDRSKQCHEHALALTERIGEVIGRRWAMACLGDLLFLRGEWEAAREQLQRAADLTHSLGWSLMANIPLLGLAELSLARGEWEAAARYAEENIERYRALGRGMKSLLTEQALLAERDLLDGHPATAGARLMQVLDSIGDNVVEEPGAFTVLSLLARAHLESGDVAQASELVAMTITHVRAQHNLLALVDALRVRAMVAIRQGRWAESQADLEEGLALARPMPYPYAEAHLLQVYGRLYIEQGGTVRARERLEAAVAIFRRLGARKEVARTEVLLSTRG
jgi:tetratricopeptide (TPR) repeat protein